eukprot:TRINITY_DN19777_c0_g1_i1.p1 TRINITY_DN19777_c0_g1~~TRINITY_DN19777_c0_g1_i1.p1  ORF type:complete len:400 (-),score=117.69 TRINITY_DN19777_c0_g1_i1:47-1246(-)
MPKAEVGTAKWLNVRERKRGATKIRWHCGLCGVSCKDENGFKCHLESEKHITNESTIANQKKRGRMYVDEFSKNLERQFLDFMVVQHLNHQILAHDAYLEFMADYDDGKGDRRMKNLEKSVWGTLGVFVAYLRDRGKIDANKGVKGWTLMVTEDMLDSDGDVNSADDAPPQPIVAPNKKIKWNQVVAGGPRGDDGGDSFQLKRAQEAAAVAAATGVQPALALATDRLSNEKVAFSMPGMAKRVDEPPEPAPPAAPEAAVPTLMPSQPAAKVKASDDVWLKKHMVVKVVWKDAPGGWYKRKAQVVAVDSRHALARVQLPQEDGQTAGRVLEVQQKYLESVIPVIGKPVMVCAGEHKGKRGILEAIDEENFCVGVKLRDTGQVVTGLVYEHVCKYNHNTIF